MEIIRFFIKILNFLWRSGGGLAPSPEPHILQVLNYYRLSWGADPRMLGKIKVARGQFRKKSQKFAIVREGLCPRTPWTERIFNYYIFVQIRAKIHEIFEK